MRFPRACAIRRDEGREYHLLSIASDLELLVSRNRSNCVGNENIAVRHELRFAISRKERKRKGGEKRRGVSVSKMNRSRFLLPYNI